MGFVDFFLVVLFFPSFKFSALYAVQRHSGVLLCFIAAHTHLYAQHASVCLAALVLLGMVGAPPTAGNERRGRSNALSSHA